MRPRRDGEHGGVAGGSAMTFDFESCHLTLSRSQERLRGAERHFVELFRHGPVSVELYAPQGVDPQQPHEQDELYIVVSGRGNFVNGPVRHPFGPGDVMFVPAGVIHRFEDFSDNFMVWVVFCGPPGGHQAAG
jgi:mannose-6-phosphate isomerase-like protein (cupin superfamily)